MIINTMYHRFLALVAVLILTTSLAGYVSAEVPPGYDTEIPSKIMTPDTIKTRIGKLKFFDGLPTEETTQKVFDNLDFMRGVEVFLTGIPAASVEAIRRGMAEMKATQANQVVLMDKLLDSNPLFLTGNTDTVYASAIFDLERDGPREIFG